jgi:4-alpha-glucanotransferase
VQIRSELGLLEHPVEQEQAASAERREAWAQVLRAQGWLDWAVDVSTDAGIQTFTVALYRALGHSPARLLGVSLADVFGDRRAQNQPGTDQEYPNWRIAMTDSAGTPVVLENLLDDPELLRPIIAAVRDGRTLEP